MVSTTESRHHNNEAAECGDSAAQINVVILNAVKISLIVIEAQVQGDSSLRSE